SNSCKNNCGFSFDTCSCDDSCRNNRTCCYDYNRYCLPTTTTTWPTTTDFPSCMYNCGQDFGSCSCANNCHYYGICCPDYESYCSQTTTTEPTTTYGIIVDEGSCENNCGKLLPICGCDSLCQQYGDCCPDYDRYCLQTTTMMTTTTEPTTTYGIIVDEGSCENNCGQVFGICSCAYDCQDYHSCCDDYNSYCLPTTTTTWPTTTDFPSCMYNCGQDFGSCSCANDCHYYGICCPDYESYCSQTTTTEPSTTYGIIVDEGSCENNCGKLLPICGCDNLCQQYGNCCPDYDRYCLQTTTMMTTTTEPTTTYGIIVDEGSCENNCGQVFGICSCAYDCQDYHSCCDDYNSYCLPTTTTTWPTTTDFPSCMYNCGQDFGSCSCANDCHYYGICCPDYESYCSQTTTTEPTTTYGIIVDEGSCENNCGKLLPICGCDNLCQQYGNCCPDYDRYCLQTTTMMTTTTEPTTTYGIIVDEGSCENNCGQEFGICSCAYDCQDYHSCCDDYNSYCLPTTTTTWPTTTDFPSCMYNCGQDFGSCSCASNCHYYGICCPDYESYCSQTTTTEPTTTYGIIVDEGSCENNCGKLLPICGCDNLCQQYGNCCPDYDRYCLQTTTMMTTTTEPTTTYGIIVDEGSCKNNCGQVFGICSCAYDCQYYHSCCDDYNSFCQKTTTWPTTTASSCRYSCGYDLGLCSCSSECKNYGYCCPDYESFCIATIHPPDDPTAPSCMYNCGYHLGYCSCSRACQYFGDCCHDYESVCLRTTTPTTAPPTTSTHMADTADAYSCENICGQRLPLCSCEDDCQYYGGCCPDYHSVCFRTTTPTTTTTTTTTTTSPPTSTHMADTADAYSCENICGQRLPVCSCEDDCQYYGSCCPDYHSVCFRTTTPTTTTTTSPPTSTHMADTADAYSCENICGQRLPLCSCEDDCQYYGGCCPDYHRYCPLYSTPASYTPVGRDLYGSGVFTSPNYPNYYNDNTYHVWYLTAQQGQRIFLTFTDVQLERCCNCDYITVYDGSSTGYPQLGNVCFSDTTHQVFHSSSQYLTVAFRSDYSVVSQGFKGFFTSSLSEDKGHVDCSSDNIVIFIQRSYLNSLGMSANDLYVDDHLCRPTINSTEVVFSFPLDACGTAKERMNGYVSYTNNVRASQSQSGEITHQSQFLLHVGCRMEPDTMVQIFYKARENINDNITGTGSFNASIAFFTSSSFNQQIYDSPYEVSLNQNLYVQVKLNRPDNSLDLFLDTCVVSPNPNDFKDHSYDLLRNGCPRDNTYYSYTSGLQNYAQFRFQSFKFLRAHTYVYVQCKVIFCPDNDYNSRCHQGCLSRRRRSLDSSTYHTNMVTLGPIKLKGRRRSVKGSEKSKE
ncbi:hypothetical protein QQF64_011011, partial [Cirrhinus molitorella]